MNRHFFISNLESNDKIFSELNFELSKKVYDFWKTKKVTKVFQVSNNSDKGIEPIEVIFKTAQGFYILIKKIENEDWSMTIYYNIEQENELKLFTKNLIKQIKDATDNNR